MRQNQSIDRIIAIIDTRSSVRHCKIHIKYIKLLIISTIELSQPLFIEPKSNITSRKVSEFLLLRHNETHR